MADKSTTIFEPAKSDVQAITIIYADGYASSVEVSCSVRSSDTDIQYAGNISELPSNFSANVQTSLDDLVTEVVQKVIQNKGF